MADVVKRVKIEVIGLREIQSELDRIESTLTNVADPAQMSGLSKEAENLTGKLSKANAELETVSKVDYSKIAGGIGQIAGGLGAIATAGALLGQGNEDAEKFFKTFATGLAITNAIKGATETYIGIQVLQTAATEAQAVATVGANTATQTLNKSLLTSPLFAVVAVIGAAAAAYAIFAEEASSVAKAQGEINKQTAVEVAEMTTLFELLKRSNPETERRKELIEEINATYGTTLKNLDDETAFASQLAGAYAQVNAQLEKKIKQEVYQESLTDLIKQEIEATQELKSLNAELAEGGLETGAINIIDTKITYLNNQLTDLKKEKDAIFADINAVSSSAAQAKKMGSPISLDKKDEPKDTNTTVTAKVEFKFPDPEDYESILNDATNFTDWANSQNLTIDVVDENSILADNDFRIEAETEYLTRRQAILKQFLDEGRINNDEYLEYLKKGEQETQQFILQKRAENASKSAVIAQQYAGAVNNLSQGIFALTDRFGKQDEKSKDERARRQFKVQKALSLSLAVIDGFKAITTSLAYSPVAIGPTPNPAGIASLAFATATTAANIAKIASSKYEGGSTTGGDVSGAIPGGGGLGDISGGSTAPIINFNQNGDGKTNNVGAGGSTFEIKNELTISEVAITDVQKRVAAYSEAAKL